LSLQDAGADHISTGFGVCTSFAHGTWQGLHPDAAAVTQKPHALQTLIIGHSPVTAAG
jgi:hypothetical protein